MINFPVEIENASFGYEKKLIFEDVSIKIKEKEIFCLMGRNGCGKSTLIDSILNINKISNGSIEINGKNLKDYSTQELAKNISYVPQIHNKSFPYTVWQVVLMGRTVYTKSFGRFSYEDEEIARNVMKKVGISHLADRPYTYLSGGEMQMVMLARALVQDTSIIIMDEPTAYLDFYNELLFLENVISLVKNEEKTVIMATHNPNQAFFIEKKQIPIRVGLMRNGKINIVGSPSEIINSENIKSVYNVNSKIFKTDEQDALVPINTI